MKRNTFIYLAMIFLFINIFSLRTPTREVFSNIRNDIAVVGDFDVNFSCQTEEMNRVNARLYMLPVFDVWSYKFYGCLSNKSDRLFVKRGYNVCLNFTTACYSVTIWKN